MILVRHFFFRLARFFLRILYVYCIAYTTSRMRLGETHLWKMQRDAVHSITNTYSLVLSQYFVYIYKANLCLDIILIIIIISIFVDVVAHW